MIAFIQKKPLASYLSVQLFILLIFYAPFLLQHRSFYYSDTTFWLEPQAKFLADSIKSGHFPLWNPFNYCGMPQIAVSFPSLFYLPDLFLVLLPFNCGLAVSMIFHQTLAALGVYLLVRSASWPVPLPLLPR